jgi:photosystem II stability/assembly factor-like uncharacterized protein
MGRAMASLVRSMILAAAAALAGGTAVPAAAAALQPPAERPAIAVRQPERTALMGLAQAGTRVVAVGERGVVLLSDDAGQHWRQAASVPVSVTLTAVQFVGERTGWAVGHQGVVLHTDDGGEHWKRQLDGRTAAALALKDAETAGDAKSLAEAQRAVQEGADKPLLALHFVDERAGFVVGAFNMALATVDGGATWQAVSSRLPNPKGAHLYTIHRAGDLVLLAGEQGLLLHSSDGGQRFERIATPYGGSFFGVTEDGARGWLLAGLRGNVLCSADAGRTWTVLANAFPVGVTGVLRDSQGGVWLANQSGQVLRPDTDTASVKLVAATAAQQPGALLKLRDGTLLIAGWNGITRLNTPPVTP